MNEPSPDVIDRLAGLAPDAKLAALRRERGDALRHMQASEAAVFAPDNDAGISQAQRAAIALRVATLLRDGALQNHYRARLTELDPNGTLIGNAGPAWKAILAHADRLTVDPDQATRRHLDELQEAGLSKQAVVALSQLVSYVNFQSRVLAGLRMLRDAQ